MIVSAEPGTTRDSVERRSSISMGAALVWSIPPVSAMHRAGAEAEAVARVLRRHVESADIVVHVLDCSGSAQRRGSRAAPTVTARHTEGMSF
jgi:tRNA U34 5-carboxymethylaminomethyl modifying GTPase MnmE/TrmE